MMKYSKAIAGIIGAAIIYVLDSQLGFDAAGLGVADEIKFIIDGVVIGGVVYFSPANATDA